MTTNYCDGWRFAAHHVLVNRERNLFNRRQLTRNVSLDRLALLMARDAAEKADLSSPRLSRQELQKYLGRMHVSQIIQQGSSIREMHAESMENDTPARSDVLSDRYKEFGMGTARIGEEGQLVMVQLFRS
jgi:uncharacterized protein YkwD